MISYWIDENSSCTNPFLRLGSIKKQSPYLGEKVWHPFVPIYFQNLAFVILGLGMENLLRFVGWLN